ncbi:hypothetical protein [Thermococcus celer]|uniref:Uncharacterized protein n=1 Tax=Thermococcus celer Vu 13 = JCM 8558 TaxID=1293037 RepID=A0A218P3Q1_THECE|nr:hypothetical protein [Thermococcus celer]ASI99537.1 hypothetical protein A3L02_08170 [Thermococcus celer Vu 13 = JCM 8558]
MNEASRLSYKLDGSTVKVNLRASFERLRAPMYMRVSDDDLRNRILDIVDSVVNEVSKEYGIEIELNKADIILH